MTEKMKRTKSAKTTKEEVYFSEALQALVEFAYRSPLAIDVEPTAHLLKKQGAVDEDDEEMNAMVERADERRSGGAAARGEGRVEADGKALAA